MLGFGLDVGGQLVLESTICNEIRQAPQPVIFGHASEHPHYASHHTPRLYGLESYVSVPIFRPDGSFFGTLCAIDSAPATFDEAQVVRSLELFAELIGNYLHTEQRLQQAVADLSAANDTAVLRDQFIAVLGHDLRSPLQAASMATEMLELEPHTERGGMLLRRVRESITRIDGLVKDVLDFARGRLGGGIPVALTHNANVAAQLMQVVHEVAGATGRSDIIATIAVDAPLLCDANRLSQLLANLLTNGYPVRCHRVGAAGPQRWRDRAGQAGQAFHPVLPRGRRPAASRPRTGAVYRRGNRQGTQRHAVGGIRCGAGHALRVRHARHSARAGRLSAITRQQARKKPPG
jgi:hypothetical protein